MSDDVFTPAMLAKRWGCHVATVRQLIHSGRLAAFRVGPKLLRVTAVAVADFESRSATPCPTADAAPRVEAGQAALSAVLLAYRLLPTPLAGRGR